MIKDKVINNVLISVIVATYNREKFAYRAIQSILNQTYQNLECIVVDDGSTDNTKDVVGQIQDARIRYIRLDNNRGVAAARNEGIKKAQGDYIAFLDSDDEYLLERIEENLKVISVSQDEVSLICSNFWYVDEGRGRRSIAQKGPIDALWHIPSPSTWFLRRDVFDKIGLFDETFIVDEDRDFLFRFHNKLRLAYIDQPLAKRYKLQGRLSFQIEKYAIVRRIFLQKHQHALRRKRKYLAYHLYRLGKDLIVLGQKKMEDNIF